MAWKHRSSCICRYGVDYFALTYHMRVTSCRKTRPEWTGGQMQRKYPNLCKPITLGRTTFRNRMFSAPMGGTDITSAVYWGYHAALDI